MAVAHPPGRDPIPRAGRFPQGGSPCPTAITLPTPNGGALPISSPTATTTATVAIPGRTTAASLTASFGTCTPAPPGPTPPGATAPGRPSTTASTAGGRTAPGPRSSTPCCGNSMRPASSSATCGASMAPSTAPTRPPPGRKKNPESPPQLGGPQAAQMQEPPDHALGRSRGGFGTKTHLVCDSNGIVLAVWVTAGQRHETQGFEPVMGRAQRPRQDGQKRWPEQAAGERGTAMLACAAVSSGGPSSP